MALGMKFLHISVIVLSYFTCCTVAKSHEAHLLPEVKIVGYEGPLTSAMIKLFRGAELIEIIDSHFTSVTHRLFSVLPKLRKVYFENITCTNVHPEVARDVHSVEEFYFIRCNWDDPQLESWNGFTNLKKLVISEQSYPITELKANSLNETKMKYLELVKNGIEKIDDLAFNNLEKLETLILADNKLKIISKETLKPLKSLKELDVHGNLLESFGTQQIPNLPNLESINLSHNPLKNLDLNGVENVAPKLKTVDLTGVPISDVDGLEKLHKTLNINFIRKVSD